MNRIPRLPNWAQGDAGLETFHRYCAPTALAALMGVPKREAAELLRSIPGMCGNAVGCVNTWAWNRFLKEDLGGEELSYQDLKKAHPKYDPDAWAVQPDPTVAQFLRAYPTGTFVLGSTGHTFIVCDGEIVGDTSYTSGMRYRVLQAIRMPSRAEGLVEEEREAWEGRQQRHAASKARRRKARKQREQDFSIDRFFRF